MQQIERSFWRILELWPDNIAISAGLAFIIGLAVLWVLSSRI